MIDRIDYVRSIKYYITTKILPFTSVNFIIVFQNIAQISNSLALPAVKT